MINYIRTNTGSMVAIAAKTNSVIGTKKQISNTKVNKVKGKTSKSK